MGDSIDRILRERKPSEAAAPAGKQEDKFYSIPISDGAQENYLEFQLSNGLRTCFSYAELIWFNLDPEDNVLDLDFGGFMVAVKGRGLGLRLFTGIKQKRVAWIKEADSELQDHKDNEVFIEAITITPTESGAPETE